jgi:hypothetical protein
MPEPGRVRADSSITVEFGNVRVEWKLYFQIQRMYIDTESTSLIYRPLDIRLGDVFFGTL